MDNIIEIPIFEPDGVTYDELHAAGYNALWAGFGIAAITTFILVVSSWGIPTRKRAVHVLGILTSVATALSYLAMTTGYGNITSCRETVGHEDGFKIPELSCRIDSEMRYNEWLLTTTLLIINLALVAGLGGAQTLVSLASGYIVLWSTRVIVSQENDHHIRQRWIWVVVVILAYISLLWNILGQAFDSSKARGATVQKFYIPFGITILALWTINLGVWVGSLGSGALSADCTAITFTVVDSLLKCTSGVVLAFACRRFPDVSVELGGYWATGTSTEGRIRLGDETEN
ncbi:hypothetical protein VHEMI04659 [[Torrubiella] hemipterigena]|uniref:Opsin-1 n=1 Tax=[Torrubiella] hemipterigena TaxID=1531966 RepID=A0A0A1TEI9_9HYPO|nr:hypothetical protein VHEMI04659 [[Torrubiella] hemipterigena]